MNDSFGDVDVAIVGGGPAGLFVAERIATQLRSQSPGNRRRRIVLFDRMPTPGRKFLLAGRGGLNLTHSDPIDQFVERYGPDAEIIKRAVGQFPPSALRDWADALHAETFIGTSGRVFPKALRATPLLRAWLQRLDNLGVEFELNTRWVGFEDRGIMFCRARPGFASQPEETFVVRPSFTVFALGGASWPRLGADGSWTDEFRRVGIAVTDLAAANCGFQVSWSEHVQRLGGQPLKNIAVSCEGSTVKGELLLDPRGIEGNAVYALGREIRASLARGNRLIQIDLRADLSLRTLTSRLEAGPGKQSISSWLRKAAGLTPPALAVLRECVEIDPIKTEPETLAAAIKAVPIAITSTYPIDRAISTAGGIRLDEVTDQFELKKRRNSYAIGEMLDWEAPTGGYLLQACFSTAHVTAEAIVDKLRNP
jgi:uncharacterized flavoprotein (TIGR03862 family)